MAVSLRVTGTWAELIADGTVAIPATPQAGDRMYLFARWKDFSVTATVANWIEVTQFADGSVTAGNGTGSVKVACWYRDWQSGDTDPTIAFSSAPNNASVVIMVMQKGADDVWDTPVARTAAMTNWTTTSQIVSASSTVSVRTGSVVMGLIGIRDDTVVMTRPTTGIDDSAGVITWNGDYVESPATHHSTITGFDGAADLGYRLVTTGAAGVTLRMTGTISAAETGAALWVIQDTTIVVTPSSASLIISTSASALASAVIPSSASLAISSFAPSLKSIVTPANASLTISTSSPSFVNAVIPASQTLTITTSAPTFPTIVIPASRSLSLTRYAPTIRPFDLVYLDPGGDAVQTDGYFGVAQGTGTVSFDTSQKRNGVGSWKFDSGVGNGNPHRKVAGVLGPAGRIGFYFRYSLAPDTYSEVNGFTNNQSAYSGGGFVDSTFLNSNDGQNATATPAKNGAQGSTLGDFAIELSEDYIIDSIKIVYERYYSTASSIGISRVRWLMGGEEGPNHDNTDEPLEGSPIQDRTVEVDITADRTWTASDINQIQVIAEALRGDTDTPHTQLWDYVAVRIEFHSAIPILIGQTVGGAILPLRLNILPTGSGVVLRFMDANAAFYDGITIIPPNTWVRVAICFVEHSATNLEVKVFLDGVEELSLVDRVTFGATWPEFIYGWISQPGASKLCWFDQILIDNVDDLTDPGPILMTAKLPAAVNADNFDTTGGTGAINERPVSLTNYKQQAGSSQVLQNYTLQTASAGDIDISGETLIGRMGWLIAKKGSGAGSGEGLTVNGDTMGVSLSTSAALVKSGVLTNAYPSNAAGIGLRSIDGDADSFLYECGVIVAYIGPDTDDPLFPLQLLQEDTSASVSDSMGGTPPATYELRNEVAEVPGTIITTTISSRTAEGETPQQQAVIESNGGGEVGIVAISPGAEVSVNIDVAGADASVELRRVDQIIV